MNISLNILCSRRKKKLSFLFLFYARILRTCLGVGESEDGNIIVVKLVVILRPQIGCGGYDIVKFQTISLLKIPSAENLEHRDCFEGFELRLTLTASLLQRTCLKITLNRKVGFTGMYL